MSDKPYSIYNDTVGLHLDVPALLSGAAPDSCAEASDSCGPSDITFGASVNITNYRHPKGVSSVSYVQLLASFTPNEKPRDWYVVSTTGVLGGGLLEGDSNLQICDGDHSKEKTVQTASPTPVPVPPVKGGSDGAHSTQRALADANGDGSYGDGDDDDAVKTSCCLGSPGAVYLVACIVKDYPAQEIYEKVKFDSKKRLNDYCVQVDGVCGSSCGFSTALPKYCDYDAATGRGR